MSRTSETGLRCTVEGAQNLPAELDGPDSVCAAIEKAAISALQGAGIEPAQVSVSVTVQSQYRISATASAGPRTIPEQKVGITDRTLNSRSVDMLARAIALELKRLGREGHGGENE